MVFVEPTTYLTASLQRYRSVAVVPAVSADLATLMGVTDFDGVHPLLLLQSYSNEDKPRMIRPVAMRSVVTRSDQSFFGQNRGGVRVRARVGFRPS